MRGQRTMRAVFGLALIAGLAPAGCSGCEEPDDETAIRQMVRQAAALAERHDLGELMKMTTDDFVANPNGMTRQEVKGVLLMAFRRYGKLSIEHPRPEVELDPAGDAARAELPFLVVREGAEAPDLSGLVEDLSGWLEEVSELGDAYHLELRFAKTEDGWRVERAKMLGTRGPGRL